MAAPENCEGQTVFIYNSAMYDHLVVFSPQVQTPPMLQLTLQPEFANMKNIFKKGRKFGNIWMKGKNKKTLEW